MVPHPSPNMGGSGFTTCLMALSPPPDEGGLQCRHISCGSRPASRCGRALASPRVLWNRARLPTGEGSGVSMCPTVSNPPPGAGGLWRHHVSHSSWCAMDHKQKGLSRSTYLVGTTCLRGLPAHSQGTWHQAHHDLARHME
jgi:hypothetical protein